MRNKGFTLIELLVVILIISVLSSIIFVSFGESRHRARLANAQSFDAQLSHELGAYVVGIWSFENIGSSNIIYDESGYGNDGTIHGNPVSVNSEIYPGTKALDFDGSADFISLNSFITIDHTKDFTISYWIKARSWNAQDGQGAGIYTKSDDTRDSYMNIDGDAVRMQDIPGADYIIPYTFHLDQWYHVAITFTTANIKLYVDGKYAASTGSLNNDVQFNHIARGYAGKRLDGCLDNIRIYNKDLSIAQIQQHFAAGAAARGIALNDK